jgi:hypothetical protein
MKNIFYITFLLFINILANEQLNFLFLTDIHLDLLYDSLSNHETLCRNTESPFNMTLYNYDFGRYDCDTPTTLFNSMLNNLKQNQDKLDLIILNGDQIAHNLYKVPLGDDKLENKKLYKKIFEFIYKNFQIMYPGVPILPVIGNNDFYEHYTTPDPDSKKEQVNYFKSLYFNNTAMLDNLNTDHEATLNDGMYYSYKFKEGLKFIMFNSVIYSYNNKKFSNIDCDRELEWLERELNTNEKKIICMHVPPYPFYYDNRTEFYIREEYMKKFDDLMYKYKDTVVNVLSSHLHWMKFGIRFKSQLVNYVFHESTLPETDMDRFINTIVRSKKILNRSKQLRVVEEKYFNVINFASLSPVYDNSPTYSVIKFNSGIHQIDNIKTFHANLNNTLPVHSGSNLDWDIQYDLKKDFGFSTFDNEDIYDFIYNRVQQLEIKKLLPYYLGGYPRYDSVYFSRLIQLGMIDESTDYKKLLCAYKEIFEVEVKKCEDL